MPTLFKNQVYGTPIWTAERGKKFVFLNREKVCDFCEHTFEKEPEIPPLTATGLWNPCPTCLSLGRDYNGLRVEKPDVSTDIRQCKKSKMEVDPPKKKNAVKQTKQVYEEFDPIKIGERAAEIYNSFSSIERVTEKNEVERLKQKLADSPIDFSNLESMVMTMVLLGWSFERVVASAAGGKADLSDTIVYESEEDDMLEVERKSEIDEQVIKILELAGEYNNRRHPAIEKWEDIVLYSPIQRFNAQQYADDYRECTYFERSVIRKILLDKTRFNLNFENDINFRPKNFCFESGRLGEDPLVIKNYDRNKKTLSVEDLNEILGWKLIASPNQLSRNKDLSMEYKEENSIGKVYFVTEKRNPLPSLMYSGRTDFVLTPRRFELAKVENPVKQIPIFIAEISAINYHIFNSERPDVSEVKELTKKFSVAANLLNVNSCGIPRIVQLSGWSKNIRHAPTWPFDYEPDEGFKAYFASCRISPTGLIYPIWSLECGQEVTVDFKGGDFYDFCGPKCPVLDLIGAPRDLVELVFGLGPVESRTVFLGMTEGHIIVLDQNGFDILKEQKEAYIQIQRINGTISGHKFSSLTPQRARLFYKNDNMVEGNILSSYVIHDSRCVSPRNVVVAKSNVYLEIDSKIPLPEEVREKPERKHARRENVDVEKEWRETKTEAMLEVFKTLNIFLDVNGHAQVEQETEDDPTIESLDKMIQSQCEALSHYLDDKVNLKWWADLLSEHIIGKKEMNMPFEETETLEKAFSISCKEIANKWNKLYKKLPKKDPLQAEPPQKPLELAIWYKKHAAEAIYQSCFKAKNPSLRAMFGPKARAYGILKSVSRFFEDDKKREDMAKLIEAFDKNYSEVKIKGAGEEREEEEEEESVVIGNGVNGLVDMIMSRVELPKDDIADEYADALEKVIECEKAENSREMLSGLKSSPAKCMHIILDLHKMAKKDPVKAVKVAVLFKKLVLISRQFVENVERNYKEVEEMEESAKTVIRQELLKTLLVLKLRFSSSFIKELKSVDPDIAKKIEEIGDLADKISIPDISDLSDKYQILSILSFFWDKHFGASVFDESNSTAENVVSELLVLRENEGFSDDLKKLLDELDVLVGSLGGFVASLNDLDVSEISAFKKLFFEYMSSQE